METEATVAARNIILLVSLDGSVERFDGSFREFVTARGIEHVGPMIEQGLVYCSVRVDRDAIVAVHWASARPGQVAALALSLRDLGLDEHQRCDITAGGERVATTLGRLTAVPARQAALNEAAKEAPSGQAIAAEGMRASLVSDDLSGMTMARVVWEREPEIRLHDPETVSLADQRGLTPGTWALHVGDPEFWHTKLSQDYGRDDTAWEIEILPAPGDVLVEDVQYAMPEEDGSRGDSAILLTDRRVLREGVDFRYVRELSLLEAANRQVFQF